MKTRRIAFAITIAGIVGFALAGPVATAEAGSATFVVQADTSYLSGVAGKIEFQFIPDGTPAFATATVFNYSQTADTTLAGTSSATGDASGTLPAHLNFDNGTALNDVQQGITFGTTLSFDVKLTWAGPAPDGTSSTVFSFFLEDKDGEGLNLGPNNEALDLKINGDGSKGFTTYTNDNGKFDVRVHQQEGTPEPSSVVLMGIGVIGFIACARSRKRLRRKSG